MKYICNSRAGRFLLLMVIFITNELSTVAQVTFPVNGVADFRQRIFIFTNATIVQNGQSTLTRASLLIQEGKIVAVGQNISIPKDAVVIDCTGKFIYPSFIDIYSDYGIPIPQRPPGDYGYYAPIQFLSKTQGAFDWNQAIKPEVNGAKIFSTDFSKAKDLRDIGFGSVLTHQKDGIARGTGVFVSLGNTRGNLAIIKERASAHYSFSKGSSTQNYPSSLMGTIALLRQTYLNAQWYKSKPVQEGINISLQSWNESQDLPQIFEGNDKWNDLRAFRIGEEFGVKYIIKGGGNEYQRIQDIASMKATFILPLNFPMAIDVEDPNDARFVSLGDMKHWELAPTNPGAFEKAGINFCLTAADLKDLKQFKSALRKALDNGLSETRALDALTKTPATLLGVYDQIGSLETGKLANFLICTGPVFDEKTSIAENWVQGEKYDVKTDEWSAIRGTYNLALHTPEGNQEYSMNVQSASAATITGKDTIVTKFNYDGKLVNISFSPVAAPKKPDPGSNKDSTAPKNKTAAPVSGPVIRLSGSVNGNQWYGNGTDSSGNAITWTATFMKSNPDVADTAKKKLPEKLGSVVFPFDGYGWEVMPKPETLLFRNATVWTNEKEGILYNTDVLVRNGKIAEIGKNLNDPSAKIIDGTGKYLTPGIIDEHSHIAAASINEGAQSVTSEVRIGDNLNPEDINIYRQLAGGVTSSHILHGSANTIGGQTQLIKLRWGANDEELKFKNWDPFIKFALGENVKRNPAPNNNRFPDTRMGVAEVLHDAFQRATDYQNEWKMADSANRNKNGTPVVVRRDLELDALVAVMNKKIFITCHSYKASEIIALMRITEKYGFRVNTFTHILEGYKVADKIKVHGANVSTFSDWWAYKVEVEDAIAYNATIMQRVGLNVCINSDDAEQARRLNQEAAKSVKYGGMSEEDAFKMVTLNPAIALHVDDRVGSIKKGKDADLVLWSDNPLSVYAKALTTVVDGTVYFDIQRDSLLRQRIILERNRLMQKMISLKKSGTPVKTASPSYQFLQSCGEHVSGQHLITYTITDGDLNMNY
jgi:imidazolonepropionase-like amidohydrolase